MGEASGEDLKLTANSSVLFDCKPHSFLHSNSLLKMSVAELKAKGNAEFAAKRYEEAIKHYSDAIAAVSGEADAPHVLHSNRSACYAGLRQWDQALQDADKTIELNPSFAKGYGRKGGALHGARKFDESIAAFEQGLKIAPTDAGLKKGLEEVQKAQAAGAGGGPDAGLGKMFGDPKMFEKLSANPKTAHLLADQSFVQKLKSVQQNPAEAMSSFNDPRMIQVMGVLMGIDMQAFERPEGSNDLPADLEGKREEIEKQTGRSSEASSSNAKQAPAEPAKPATPPPAAAAKTEEKAAPATDDVEMKDEAGAEDAKAKAEAEGEKKKGNELYLKRQFDPAIEHYSKAWELHKDITYLNNLGACYFEQGNFEECIKTCRKAVEEGREMRADYKLVAKAFGRIGSAYQKQGDLSSAIENYNRSLTEHRTPDILNKLRDAEKTLKEQQKQAYIDPAKAEEERNKGNDLYKAGKFAEAVAAFTESIKRNPSEPKGYTNRASAYTKLAALPQALKDCEEAIKIDPSFVKGYIRKATVLLGMKEHSKALEAIQKGEDIDKSSGSTNSKEIQSLQQKIHMAMYAERSNETDEETFARASKDPKVAQLLQDPAMQHLLQSAQSDPQVLQDAMKNPSIKEKIMTLVNAGIIKTR
ncbi:unnamed protein product [Sympodiomycopsis kandeliae]